MPDVPSLSSRAQIPAQVLFRELQGELVLLQLERGAYFGLDPVGAHIWQLLREERSLGEVVQALVAEYDVSEPRAREDVVDLVRRLQEHGLVDMRD
jgi:hypothetical protein